MKKLILIIMFLIFSQPVFADIEITDENFQEKIEEMDSGSKFGYTIDVDQRKVNGVMVEIFTIKDGTTVIRRYFKRIDVAGTLQTINIRISELQNEMDRLNAIKTKISN